MEIKNKLTGIREEEEGYNRAKKGKGHQRTCIKDTWTKPKAGRFKGERWGWVRRVVWWGSNGDNCT